MIDWNNILKLPPATLAGDKTIPKTQLAAQGSLTKTEEKKLKDMDSLTFFASLSKVNTYMLPVKDSEHDIEAILVLRCVLRTSMSPAELGDILHKIFPNPTVVLFEAPSGRVGISVAIKRKSLAEHGAVVVENTQNTGLIETADAVYASFFEGLSYEALPQENLLVFVNALSMRCMLSRTVGTLGFYPKCNEAQAETLVGQVKKLQLLQSEVNDLQKAHRDKDITFAESTKIRLQLNEKKQQRECVVNDIREICNG